MNKSTAASNAEAMIQTLSDWSADDLAALLAAGVGELGRRSFPGVGADPRTLNSNFADFGEGLHGTDCVVVEALGGTNSTSVEATWHHDEGTLLFVGANGHSPEQAGHVAAALIRTLAAVAA